MQQWILYSAQDKPWVGCTSTAITSLACSVLSKQARFLLLHLTSHPQSAPYRVVLYPSIVCVCVCVCSVYLTGAVPSRTLLMKFTNFSMVSTGSLGRKYCSLEVLRMMTLGTVTSLRRHREDGHKSSHFWAATLGSK